MLIALLVVMAGVLLLTMVFNNRREPSRWYREGVRDDGGGSSWVVYAGDSGGDSGGDCGSGADGGGGGGCDGGGGGGGD
jgi:hypothetical protein